MHQSVWCIVLHCFYGWFQEFLPCQAILSPDNTPAVRRNDYFYSSVVFDFWRNQNNRIALTPAIEASANFSFAQKVLSDSNKTFTFILPDFRLQVSNEVKSKLGRNLWFNRTLRPNYMSVRNYILVLYCSLCNCRFLHPFNNLRRRCKPSVSVIFWRFRRHSEVSPQSRLAPLPFLPLSQALTAVV